MPSGSSLFLKLQDVNLKKPVASQDQSAAELISKRIAELGDWRGILLKRMRKLISSLDGNMRRAIDIHEKEKVEESAFNALVRQAVALNISTKSKRGWFATRRSEDT